MTARSRIVLLAIVSFSVIGASIWRINNPSVNADPEPQPSIKITYGSLPEEGMGNFTLSLTNTKKEELSLYRASLISISNDESYNVKIKSEQPNDKGQILFNNLEPGPYQLIVATGTDVIPNGDLPRIISIEADEVIEEEIDGNYTPNIQSVFKYLSLANAEKTAPNSTFNLKYSLTDPDSEAKVTFYLDNDKEGYDGSPVGQPCGESQSGTCPLPMSGQSGTKYIYAIINEDSGAPQVFYAQGSLTVEAVTAKLEFHTPTTSTSTGQNQPLKISYSTLDVPSNASVSMYLAPANQKEKGGEKINGCQNVAKGSNKTCNLNSSDYSPGEYVIQGDITIPGGSNSLTYSPVFTVTPAQPIAVKAKLQGKNVVISWRDNTTKGGGNTEIFRSTTGANGQYISIGNRPALKDFNYGNNQSTTDPKQIIGSRLKDYQAGKYYYKLRTYSQKVGGGLIYSPFSAPAKGER